MNLNLRHWQSCPEKLGFLFFAIILSFTVSGQSISWKKVWKQEVKSEAFTDSLKVLDILKWISKKVDYETNIKYQKDRSNVNLPVARRAYIEGKAVCIGFAKLFEALCEAAGLPVITVEGIAYLPIDNSMENHAWNLVKYNNKWKVVDPTWSSGYVENNAYKSKFSARYVDIPFKERMFSHYPYDPALQVCERPITFDQFTSQKVPSSDAPLTFDGETLDSILNSYAGLTDTGALKRSLTFKPKDPFLQLLLADEYMQMAENHVKPCIKWYRQGPNKKQLESCKKIILETERWLRKSRKYYRAVKKTNHSNTSSTDINLQNIERNLNTLQRMKSFSP